MLGVLPMNCNWSVSAGLLWLSTLALAIWLLSPSQILVGDKWMDRADVILQSDEIAGRQKPPGRNPCSWTPSL
jgi:hypothetical protein